MIMITIRIRIILTITIITIITIIITIIMIIMISPAAVLVVQRAPGAQRHAGPGRQRGLL